MRLTEVGVLGLILVAGTVGPASAQQARAHGQEVIVLSLDEAVRLALGESEEIQLARSRIDLAEAQVTSVRAQALPQINANMGYTRTFASSFSTGGGMELPDSLLFEPDTTASFEERVRYLERRVPTAGLGGLGALFGDLPFGRENAYNATISGSQVLYSGGRVGAALDMARSFREATRLNLAEEAAEIELQVRSAYVQALLAREVEAATEAALEQAEAFLEQERLRERSGQASELDVLRARVDRDNLRPQLIAARNAAEVALLNVKRLTDIPMTAPLVLSSELTPPSPEMLVEVTLEPEALTAQRAAIGAAEKQVAISEQQVKIARAAYLPDVVLQTSYGRLLLPKSAFDFGDDWRTDWAVTLGVHIPIFQGHARSAEVQRTTVELQRTRLQLGQLQEAVQLQYQQAINEKRRAAEAITGREATVEVAQRVYELTDLRYEQGLATQLEVNAARLSLLQARTNLAQAVADFYMAEAEILRATAGPEITVPQQ